MPPTADHLTPEVSDRGLLYMPPIRGTYGQEVRVYTSSSVDPHIWLTAAGPVHLTPTKARRLAEQLMALADEQEAR